MAGAARDDCAPAGECARTPVKLCRITCRDMYIAHSNTKLLGDDLRKTGKVSLPLRANTGCYTDFAVRSDGHARAFLGADSSPFHIAHHTNLDVFSFSTQLRLFDSNKVLVINKLDGFFDD